VAALIALPGNIRSNAVLNSAAVKSGMSAGNTWIT
jgi:hypothetical protein